MHVAYMHVLITEIVRFCIDRGD